MYRLDMINGTAKATQPAAIHHAKIFQGFFSGKLAMQKLLIRQIALHVGWGSNYFILWGRDMQVLSESLQTTTWARLIVGQTWQLTGQLTWVVWYSSAWISAVNVIGDRSSPCSTPQSCSLAAIRLMSRVGLVAAWSVIALLPITDSPGMGVS